MYVIPNFGRAFRAIAISLLLFPLGGPPLLGQYTGAAPFCGENGGLIINEWSNGTVGSQEYIEFAVVGDGLVNLDGYIINDNSAAMNGVGNAPGYLKFGDCFSAVPAGSLIVVYNASDPNPLLPDDDPTDSDGDGIYVVPHTDACIESCYSNPTSNTDLHCPCANPAQTGVVWPLGFSNSNDLIQVLDPCETVQHAISYGLSAAQVPNSISSSPVWVSFAGSGGGSVFYFDDGNWSNAATFTKANADNSQTPGAANTPFNAIFLAALQDGDLPCNGTILRCEKTDAGDVLPPSNAADFDSDLTTVDTIELCVGSDLNTFSVDYSAPDETEPPNSFAGTPYQYAFILTEADSPAYTIIEFNTTGDFDLSPYPVNTFLTVWGFSYIQSNGSVDINTFLNNQGSIQDIQAYDDCGYHGDLAVTQLTIQIVPTTSVDLMPLGPFCEGADAIPLPTVIDGAEGSWSGPGVNTEGDGFDPSSLGTGDYNLTFTPEQPCRTPAGLTVTVSSGQTTGIPSGPLRICYTISPFDYTDNLAAIEAEVINGQSDVVVNWYEDAALSNPIDLNNPDEVFAWAPSDPGMLWVTLSNGECESGAVAVAVEASANPAPNDGTLEVCAEPGGATVDLSLADALFMGGDPTLTVTYHLTATEAENGDNPLSESIDTESDTTVFVRVESTAGCFATAQLAINLLPPPTAFTAGIAACDTGSGATFDLTTLEASILNGQTGTVTFYADAGANDPIANPANFSLPGGGAVYALVANALCTSAEPATITLTETSTLTTEVVAASDGCFGQSDGSVNVLSVTGGAAPFAYSLDGAPFTSVAAAPFTISDLASGTYTLSIRDASGCQEDREVVIPEAAELTLDLGDNHEIKFGESVLLEPEPNFEPADWTWEPAETLITPENLSTFAAPTETTTYRLEVFDAAGCSATDFVTVFVRFEVPIYMPSAFSPNGDGTNDIIYPFAGDGVERVERFSIFDRWGGQVWSLGPFQPNDPEFGWDGKVDGRPYNPGVFVYFLEVSLTNGQTVLLKGDITLIR